MKVIGPKIILNNFIINYLTSSFTCVLTLTLDITLRTIFFNVKCTFSSAEYSTANKIDESKMTQEIENYTSERLISFHNDLAESETSNFQDDSSVSKKCLELNKNSCRAKIGFT